MSEQLEVAGTPVEQKKETDFSKVIPLDKSMSIPEALQAMADFHDATPQAVIDAFLNLKDFTEGTIKFKRGLNNSNPCISMEGYDTEGNYKWHSAIHIATGQPQAWVA